MAQRGQKRFVSISISGLNEEMTALSLRNFLERFQFGAVRKIKLKGCYRKDAQGKHYIVCSGIGHIVFFTSDSANLCFGQLIQSSFHIDGQRIRAYSGRHWQQPTIKLQRALKNLSLETGFMASNRRMKVCWNSQEETVRAEFDFQRKHSKLNIFVSGKISSYCRDSGDCKCVKKDYRLELSLRSVRAFQSEEHGEKSPFVFLLQLSSMPKLFFRSSSDDVLELDPNSWWSSDDGDPWTRTNKIPDSKLFSLCSIYRLTVPRSEMITLNEVVKGLSNYWWIHRSIGMGTLKLEQFIETEQQIRPFFSFPQHPELSFETMFLLNALVTKWTVPLTNIDQKFISFLIDKESSLCRDALKRMVNYIRPAFDPKHRLTVEAKRIAMGRSLRDAKEESIKVSDSFVRTFRLIVTPTTAYCVPPEYEMCNRVLRHYKSLSHKFLRVVFMDEGCQDLNMHALTVQHSAAGRDDRLSESGYTKIYDRILKIVNEGFELCGLKFKFLASSTNQLRDKSGWFIAEDERIGFTVESVRAWMGDFSGITNTAKCLARIALNFSSTHLGIHVPENEVEEITDVRSAEGNLMTDGIGKIVPELAIEIAEKLRKRYSRVKGTPSAYQVRYAGYKGVLTVWEAPPGSRGKKLFFRPSMKKFPSKLDNLEILDWSRYLPGFLNRQVILLLSALKVNYKVFLDLQRRMIRRLDSALRSREGALGLLDVGGFEDIHNAVELMLTAGFEPQWEPHLKGMLKAVRAVQLQDLLKKARIFVPKSRWMMGTVDETGLLQYGECFLQVTGPVHDPSSNDHFLTLRENPDRPTIITGPVCFGKNPCLHPGDLRVLMAVDHPELRGQVDTIVFPISGSRSHANEASGSDMDGDVYFVHWDDLLLPQDHPPMEYGAPTAKNDGVVTQQMIASFFVDHMLNNELGQICNAHVVHADLSEMGALDEKCKKLAEQAAIAVDFGKTGVPGVMPKELKPEKYPHFMEKEEWQTYHSDKILGMLYDRVIHEVDKEEPSEMPQEGPRIKNVEGLTFSHWCPSQRAVTAAFEEQMCTPGFEKYLEEAYELKQKYNRHLWVIMEQYGVMTEGEVVTGQIAQMSHQIRKRQGQLKENVQLLYAEVRRSFREDFLMKCKEDTEREKEKVTRDSEKADVDGSVKRDESGDVPAEKIAGVLVGAVSSKGGGDISVRENNNGVESGKSGGEINEQQSVVQSADEVNDIFGLKRSREFMRLVENLSMEEEHGSGISTHEEKSPIGRASSELKGENGDGEVVGKQGQGAALHIEDVLLENKGFGRVDSGLVESRHGSGGELHIPGLDQSDGVSGFTLEQGEKLAAGEGIVHKREENAESVEEKKEEPAAEISYTGEEGKISPEQQNTQKQSENSIEGGRMELGVIDELPIEIVRENSKGMVTENVERKNWEENSESVGRDSEAREAMIAEFGDVSLAGKGGSAMTEGNENEVSGVQFVENVRASFEGSRMAELQMAAEKQKGNEIEAKTEDHTLPFLSTGVTPAEEQLPAASYYSDEEESVPFSSETVRENQISSREIWAAIEETLTAKKEVTNEHSNELNNTMDEETILQTEDDSAGFKSRYGTAAMAEGAVEPEKIGQLVGTKILYPSDIQMARASAWYCVTYRSDFVERDLAFQASKSRKYYGPDLGLLISFPWVNADVLGAIKQRNSLQAFQRRQMEKQRAKEAV